MGLQFVFMRYVERFNSAWVLAVGLITSVIVFASYGFANHYLQLIPVEILLAVSWSCLWVGSLSFLLGKSVDRGTAAGLLYSMTYLSAGFGPLIGGVLADKWDFEVLMFAAAGITFLGLVLSRVLPPTSRLPPLSERPSLKSEIPSPRDVQQDAAGVWSIPECSSHLGRALLRPFRPSGRAEGRSPPTLSLSPKSGGKGVERGIHLN